MPHSFKNSSSVSSESGKCGGAAPRERVRRRLLPVEKALSALLVPGLSPSFDILLLGDNVRTALLAEREALFILTQAVSVGRLSCLPGKFRTLLNKTLLNTRLDYVRNQKVIL